MILGHKKDVRRMGEKSVSRHKTKSSLLLLWFVSFFSKTSSQKRHKISRLKPHQKKASSQTSAYASTKDFGVHKIQDTDTRQKQKYGYTFLFLSVLSLVFTCSTIFYFYDVSHKILRKQSDIIGLYTKYERIHYENQKSSILLKTLNSSVNTQEGKIFILVDSHNMINKKTEQALQSYYKRKNQSSHYAWNRLFSGLIFGGILILLCIIGRIVILNRESKTLQYLHMRHS